MTWTVLIPIILMGLIKIVVSSLPNSTVEWLIGKFEIHAKLREADVTITVDGKALEEEDKMQVLRFFNEAVFLERYAIFPGYEQAYVQPENGGIPLVIQTRKGKKDVRLYVYSYQDHVDVVKRRKKKIVAYRLRSKELQKRFATERDLA